MISVPVRRWTVYLAWVVVLSGCFSDKPAPTEILGKATVTSADLARARDSAASASGTTQATAAATAATNTLIPVKAGDSVVVNVQSTECSGNPETVKVYGAINQVVMAGSCDVTLPNQTATLGPVAADGTIYFTATHQQ